MKKFKKIFILATLICFSLVFNGSINVAKAQPQNIVSVTGVAEVYGDGEKIAAAILEYPKAIQSKYITADDFKVEGKVIEEVFPACPPQGRARENIITDAFVKPCSNSEKTIFPLFASKRAQI